VREGGSVADALAIALRTAQHAESLGFKRYWLAEHHNMAGIASSATAVLVGHIAGGTQRIRVGSGGVMLPNHAPLVVAEAFGTLAELYPGRIDLGLGRAPGTDRATMRALRRDRVETEEDFPRDVAELQRLLAPPQPGQRIVAMPGAGTKVPIWLLGSSLFSARLAAERGLPYAFASHFAPRMLLQALELYRPEPVPPLRHAGQALCGHRRAADRRAHRRGGRVPGQQHLPAGAGHPDRRPAAPAAARWRDFMAGLIPQERAAIDDFLAAAVIGGPDTGARRDCRAWPSHAGRRVHAGQRRVRPGAAAALARPGRAGDALTRRPLFSTHQAAMRWISASGSGSWSGNWMLPRAWR
jgi:luciferase family oxidoreductase group 1